MPYTRGQLLGDRRDKHSEGLLWLWGHAVKHGHWQGTAPADPETPRLAANFGPRLPCRDFYLDLSRAFAALAPATLGLANTGTLSWYAHAPQITREQEAIWLYYVEGLGSEEFRRDFKALSPEARALTLATWDAPRAYAVEDQAGDGLLAARLGISRRAAYDRRIRGVGRMVDYLNPPGRQERAA